MSKQKIRTVMDNVKLRDIKDKIGYYVLDNKKELQEA